MAEDIKKIVIIGDGYVGKTSVLRAIRQLEFQEQIPSVYNEFEIEQNVNGKRYKINYVDTAGQEEYEMLRKLSYREVDLFLLCFAVHDMVSFENIETKWIHDLENFRHVPILLVGTKADLLSEGGKPINKEKIVSLQKKIGAIGYVQCSSKTGKGIDELKKVVIKIITGQKHKSCTIQ